MGFGVWGLGFGVWGLGFGVFTYLEVSEHAGQRGFDHILGTWRMPKENPPPCLFFCVCLDCVRTLEENFRNIRPEKTAGLGGG